MKSKGNDAKKTASKPSTATKTATATRTAKEKK